LLKKKPEERDESVSQMQKQLGCAKKVERLVLREPRSGGIR